MNLFSGLFKHLAIKNFQKVDYYDQNYEKVNAALQPPPTTTTRTTRALRALFVNSTAGPLRKIDRI